MMNPYLKNLRKIEFVLTDACTGHCKHCSQGAHTSAGARIDPQVAAEVVQKVASVYDIQTVMTFGGEPLLHQAAVYEIMNTATALQIPVRQVITNGYFSEDADCIRKTAKNLAACGVNDLLLSVDAFHQESIPLTVVTRFATELKEQGVPFRLQPAWLKSPEDDNVYNRRTRAILQSFSPLQIPIGGGNVIFPEGNALTYLAEYFGDDLPQNPYEEDPRDLRCLSLSHSGDVLGANVYRQDILQIIRAYQP